MYYTTLDQIVNGISIRFNQETINVITSLANVPTTQTNRYDTCTIATSFRLDRDTL